MDKTEQIYELVIKTLEDYKAQDVVTISLEKGYNIADKIVIATGTSSTHLVTLKEKISKNLSVKKFKILSSEGEDSANWIVLDLEHVIVHLFRQEVREYYKIEKIWNV